MAPPYALWQQAHDEHPDDPEARRRRYAELMREAGHIVRRDVIEPEETCQTLEDGTPLTCDFKPGHRGRHSFDATAGEGE